MKQRIITGLILLPLAFCGFFLLDGWPFALFIGLVCMLAAFEWAKLAGINSAIGQGIYAMLVVLLMMGLYLQRHLYGVDSWQWSLSILIGLIWWLLALLLVLLYPSSRVLIGGKIQRLLMGLFILLPAWVALLVLKDFSDKTHLIAWLLALIWLADSGAYFVGRRFGKHKLLPAVSPGKSWEGLVGGMLIALLPVLGYGLYLQLSFTLIGKSLLIAALVVLVSILGDLTESLFKREAGVKDSGKLLPGHGGILDRIDSLTAAAPVFIFLIIWFGPSLFYP